MSPRGVATLTCGSGCCQVTVRTLAREELAVLVTAPAGRPGQPPSRIWVVSGPSTERIGEIAATAGIVLHSLADGGSRLEEVFLELSGVDQTATKPDGSPASMRPCEVRRDAEHRQWMAQLAPSRPRGGCPRPPSW